MRHRRPATTTRSAFVSTLVIMTCGVLMLIIVVLAHYMSREVQESRPAVLAAQAQEAALSARDWTALHAEQLTDSAEIGLSLDGLIAPTADGQLVLRRIAAEDGTPLAECRVRITDAHDTVERRTVWPLSVAATSRADGSYPGTAVVRAARPAGR